MVTSEKDVVVLPPVVQADWGSRHDNIDDKDPISLFPKVKRWFRCPIFLGDWYEHKDNVLFNIKNFIELEMGPLDVVE
jgi:hypothetical protein